jgi:hypothetical protein
VALSNTAGVVADSMLYLALVFGSQELLAGQVVGKLWMTLLALPVLAAIRPRLQPALTPRQRNVSEMSAGHVLMHGTFTNRVRMRGQES